MVKHCDVLRRTVHVVNLDPAAEHFDYPVLAGTLYLYYLLAFLPNSARFLREFILFIMDTWHCTGCSIMIAPPPQPKPQNISKTFSILQ